MSTEPHKSQKPTDEEIESRVAKVTQLLLKGAHRQDICQYVATETDWDVSSRTIDRYIDRAKKWFVAYSHALLNLDEEFGKSLLQLQDLYARALRVHDVKTALAVRKEMNSMFGFHQASLNINQEGQDRSPQELIRQLSTKFNIELPAQVVRTIEIGLAK